MRGCGYAKPNLADKIRTDKIFTSKKNCSEFHNDIFASDKTTTVHSERTVYCQYAGQVRADSQNQED